MFADAGSRPRNCSGMEEATGAPGSFAVYRPIGGRASGRDGGRVVNRPPSPLTMPSSRHTIGRREFITLLGGAAAAWPVAARGQRNTPVIGFLGAATPATTSPWTTAFGKRLRELGWIEGRNVAIEYRFAGG